MGRRLVPRYLAALEISKLTDAEAHTLVANIVLSAATSALVLGNPTMQAGVATLGSMDTALETANHAVEKDRQALKIDLATEAVSRSNLHGQLRMYATMLSNAATSPADIHAAGLTPAAPRVAKGTPPEVPASLDVQTPMRGRGKIRVLVHETGSTRYSYVAQQSTDGTTWTALGNGLGKSRVVTGASGAKIWVRFAMVRGQAQSDWCTPVLVTIP